MLVTIRQIGKYSKNKDCINHVIETIISYLVNSEKTGQKIFETFFQYKFMEEILYISNNCNCEDIILQIIKSLSMLIVNIKDKHILFFLFSNNFMNNIISNINISNYSDELIAFYVNFLKSLSLKIDTISIQFFFHHNLNSFPLLENALKIYNHPDALIRNVVRNVFLSICRLKHESFYDYLCSLPSVSYFGFIACRLRDMILKLNELEKVDRFKILKEDIWDDIIFISDVFSLQLPQIDYILTNCLFYYCIMPLIINSISSPFHQRKIRINIAIYMVFLLFHLINKESFNNMLFGILFLYKRNKGVNKFIKEIPIDAKDYYYNWEQQKKQTMHTFQEYITINFSPNFLRSIIFNKNNPYNEINHVIKRMDSLAGVKEKYNINGQEFLSHITKEILSFFSNSEFSIMVMYHKEQSKATGVNCGMSTNDSQLCIMKKMKKLYEKYFDVNGMSNKLIPNETRESIFSFLKSEDDSLVLLVNLLLREILFNRQRVINPHLYKAAGIVPCDILTIDEIKESNEKFNKMKLLNQKSKSVQMQLDKLKENDCYISVNNNISNSKNKKIKVSLTDFVIKGTVKDINANPMDVESMNTSYITFDDFTSNYFNELILQKDVYAYDDQVVSDLIETISPYMPYRTITIKLIIDNLTKLFIKETNTSREVLISSKHKEQIENLYKTFLSELQASLWKYKTLQNKAFYAIYAQYIEYCKPLPIEKLIKCNEITLPYHIVETIQNYPEYLIKVNEDSMYELFEYRIIALFLIHDLLWKLNKFSDSELIITNFPLDIEELMIDKVYTINNIGQEMKIYQCKVKETKENKENYIDCIVFVFENRLYIGELDGEFSLVKIKYKFLLSECNVHIDLNEQRMVNLIIINTKNKKRINEFNLLFNDDESSKTAKVNIDENIKKIKEIEYKLILSYFTSLINNFKN